IVERPCEMLSNILPGSKPPPRPGRLPGPPPGDVDDEPGDVPSGEFSEADALGLFAPIAPERINSSTVMNPSPLRSYFWKSSTLRFLSFHSYRATFASLSLSYSLNQTGSFGGSLPDQ